jgi:hypothetical protein
MPIPRHSVALPSVQLAVKADVGGVTELRVHGVGGSPPDAILGDLAPEQVSGDTIAGFYRSSDHRASDEDRDARRDADRHVEVFSWGGLTSRSKIRVLWLALLPFLFANLAGWMCPPGTRASTWRFRLHRLAAGLCALALTVNAALIAVMISADINAYQTSRAGIAGHQWWLAPLGWPFIAGHPARQVTFGMLVVVLFVLALVGLGIRSWRYEAVRPPYQVKKGQTDKPRKAAADTLVNGLADQEFWDGGGTVRLLTWLHVAVVGGFLAIALGVTARALAGGSPHASALGWAGITLGAVTIALAVAYVFLDAIDTPSMSTPGAQATTGTFAEKLRGLVVYLLIPAIAGLICSGWFAWLQPGTPSVRAADLPGMASVTGWTALAIAVAVGIALISALLGLRGSKGTLIGGSWVTLMLGFGSLNILLLGAEIWVTHLVGPVTSDAAQALSAQPGQIYLPYVITSGVPLLVWAVVLAILAFAAIEAVRWWRAVKLPEKPAEKYEERTEEFRTGLSKTLNVWYWSGLAPFRPLGDTTEKKGDDKHWEHKIARVQFLARAPHDAVWLLWLIVAGQLVMAVCVWQLHVQPPVLLRNIGIALAGLVLPALIAFLYAAWGDPAKRRTIGVLWDVGTFWPRSYHPLSPPCYTERAIPDLQRRMWWLHDNGGRVVLVTHSQGTVVGAAALAQPDCRPAKDYHPALITFGSPLVKLYGWAFPAYFGPALLGALVPGGTSRLHDWRNFYYPTDPIGGPATRGLSAEVQKHVDEELPDPADCYYVYGQAPPASRGHSGYWADDRVWKVINGVAAGLPDRLAPDQEPAEDTETSAVTPQAVQDLVQAPEPSPAKLAQLTANLGRDAEAASDAGSLAVQADGAGQTVEVPASEGTAPVDGDDGKVGG